jgi:tripartite-type tricarboxylate transporter receptor subunit TctC
LIRFKWHAAIFCLMALGLLAPAEAQAQDWPTRPIKFVVPFAPGGGNDIIARVIGEQLSQSLGQPIIIDNRSGAGGNIGAEFAAKSAADGYTFLVAANSVLTVNPHLSARVSFDPLTDFTPVGRLGVLPVVLAVNVTVPAKSVQELIALAKSNPDALSYASAGVGSPHHLAAELFKYRTGIKMSHIPFRGGAPAATELIAGRVQVMFAPINNVSPYLSSGSLRVLGVGGEERLPSLPEIPTIAEVGVPGFKIDNWVALVAPMGTPNEIVAKLNDAIRKILVEPEVRKKIEATGIEPAFSTALQLGDMIRADYSSWSTIAKNTGLRVD